MKEQIINILKNTIDWKFFNYLSEKLTKYEDMGFNTRIKIYVISQRGLKYVYDTKQMYETVDMSMNSLDMKALLDKLKESENIEYGYAVYIYNEEELDDDYEIDQEYKEKIYKQFAQDVSHRAKLEKMSINRMTFIPKL